MKKKAGKKSSRKKSRITAALPRDSTAYVTFEQYTPSSINEDGKLEVKSNACRGAAPDIDNFEFGIWGLFGWIRFSLNKDRTDPSKGTVRVPYYVNDEQLGTLDEFSVVVLTKKTVR